MPKELRRFDDAMRGSFAQVLAVPKDTYRWIVGLDPDRTRSDDVFLKPRGPWLVHPAGPDDSFAIRTYAPLQQANLLREFAELPPTMRAILGFANRYGHLSPKLEVLSDRQGLREGVFRGEPTGIWVAESARLGMLLALWDLLLDADVDALRPYVQWSSNPRRVEILVCSRGRELLPALTYQSRQDPWGARGRAAQTEQLGMHRTVWTESLLVDERVPEAAAVMERWEADDPCEPVRWYVHRQVNREIAKHVRPVVMPYRQGEIALVPDSLRGALYTLFALELSGRTGPPKLCEACERYFISNHGRRRHCSDACRRRAYYHRPYVEQRDDGRRRCAARIHATGRRCRNYPRNAATMCRVHQAAGGVA